VLVAIVVLVLVLERAFLSTRFGMTMEALSLHRTRPAKQRLEIEHEPEHDLLTSRLFGNERTLMRVILIRLDALVSMLVPVFVNHCSFGFGSWD
jgi:hypothetical protein